MLENQEICLACFAAISPLLKKQYTPEFFTMKNFLQTAKFHNLNSKTELRIIILKLKDSSCVQLKHMLVNTKRVWLLLLLGHCVNKIVQENLIIMSIKVHNPH